MHIYKVLIKVALEQSQQLGRRVRTARLPGSFLCCLNMHMVLNELVNWWHVEIVCMHAVRLNLRHLLCTYLQVMGASPLGLQELICPHPAACQPFVKKHCHWILRVLINTSLLEIQNVRPSSNCFPSDLTLLIWVVPFIVSFAMLDMAGLLISTWLLYHAQGP